MPFTVVEVQTCPSTMEVARALTETGTVTDACVVASTQTAGRGQFERGFFSPEGGLYLTLLWHTDKPPAALTHLTACTGAALCDVIVKLTGARPRIKPVNDVLLNGRKVAGILTHIVSTGAKTDFALIGIGVNVKDQPWPGDIAATAGAREPLTGKPVDKQRLLQAILSGMDRLLTADDPAPWLRYYEKLCITDQK